jgi:hypothetical protein
MSPVVVLDSGPKSETICRGMLSTDPDSPHSHCLSVQHKVTPITSSGRAVHVMPFQPLLRHRDLSKTGAISPLRFDECLKTDKNGNEANVDAIDDDGDSPPVDEILILKPQQIDGSTCSINEDTAPVTNCAPSEDYKFLFFSSQREIHTLQGHLSCVQEENRQLKRKMIEMQKQLYSYCRNKAQSSSLGSSRPSAWTIPPSSFSKRQRVGFEPLERGAPRNAALGAVSPVDVRMSVLTEDCISEPKGTPTV